ncbi:MAG TPA: hypothetical protein VL463_08905 [Kofleriaceae bacterium]|nr:hypothetical protein [Kofleriaceae bacterium]
MTRVLKVFFHDACFDGTASAALFTRFYRDAIAPAQLVLAPMQHSEHDPFEGIAIDGDDNACVDFRFCADPAMRWWFDHHKTAFQPPALRDIFEESGTELTWFFDPEAPSCAGLIARVLREKWGWDPPAHLREVVQWAEVIDAAKFASAADATALETPAQQLALWVGSMASPAEIARYVAGLADGVGLEQASQTIAADGITRAVGLRAHQREVVARHGRWHGDVVALDLGDEPDAVTPGFVGYELYPACRYTVALTRTPRAVKIAVGWNPWGPPRGHDIGTLCERFGGGGHAAVGGVTLDPGELVRGRETIGKMIDVLKR